LEEFVVDWMILLKCILQKEDGACPGLIWLTTGNNGGSVVNSGMNIRGPHNVVFWQS
jgi:hypothetical protein